MAAWVTKASIPAFFTCTAHLAELPASWAGFTAQNTHTSSFSVTYPAQRKGKLTLTLNPLAHNSSLNIMYRIDLKPSITIAVLPSLMEQQVNACFSRGSPWFMAVADHPISRVFGFLRCI